MSMIDEKLSIIEMDIDLILSFYGELIARGGVYIALQGIDETKKGFIEKLISRRNWGKEVYTSIKRIEKSNFRKETISTFHENLIKSFENASSDENEYILFCNEEIKKSEVIGRIKLFEKEVDESYVLQISKIKGMIEKYIELLKKIYENQWPQFRLFLSSELKVWHYLYQIINKESSSIMQYKDEIVSILKK